MKWKQLSHGGESHHSDEKKVWQPFYHYRKFSLAFPYEKSLEIALHDWFANALTILEWFLLDLLDLLWIVVHSLLIKLVLSRRPNQHLHYALPFFSFWFDLCVHTDVRTLNVELYVNVSDELTIFALTAASLRAENQTNWLRRLNKAPTCKQLSESDGPICSKMDINLIVCMVEYSDWNLMRRTAYSLFVSVCRVILVWRVERITGKFICDEVIVSRAINGRVMEWTLSSLSPPHNFLAADYFEALKWWLHDSLEQFFATHNRRKYLVKLEDYSIKPKKKKQNVGNAVIETNMPRLISDRVWFARKESNIIYSCEKEARRHAFIQWNSITVECSFRQKWSRIKNT